MKQWRETATKLGALAALWMVTSPAAFATTGGTSMPWDEPLIRIQENLTGPVASAIIIIAVALAGVMWALSDHGTGMRRVSQVIFGAGVALGAVSFVTALGFSGGGALSSVKRRSLRTVPLHSSLTRPILLGGAERDLVIIEVSLIAALLFGVGFRFASLALALLLGTVGHRLLVWIGRQDPQATRVFARHRLYQPFYPAAAAIGAPLARVPAFRGDTR